MTISGKKAKQAFICNGVVSFPLDADFIFWDSVDLVVTRRAQDYPDTDDVVLEELTDYNVTGGNGENGTVTTVATYTDGWLIIHRALDQVQPYNLVQGDGFQTGSLEEQLDKLTGMIQELEVAIQQSLRLVFSDFSGVDMEIPAVIPGRGFKFNEDGTAIILTYEDLDGAGDAAAAAKVSEINAKASEVAAEQAVVDAEAQVVLAAAEVDNAAAQVVLATNEADRSKTEADRAEIEADRAEAAGTLQTVVYVDTTGLTGTGTIPNDNTPPQITEGDSFFTVNITPKSATSKLIINFSGWNENSGAGGITTFALFRNSDPDAVAVSYTRDVKSSNVYVPVKVDHTVVLDSGGVDQIAFQLRVGVTVATTYRVGALTQIFGSAVDVFSMTITEVEA